MKGLVPKGPAMTKCELLLHVQNGQISPHNVKQKKPHPKEDCMIPFM